MAMDLFMADDIHLPFLDIVSRAGGGGSSSGGSSSGGDLIVLISYVPAHIVGSALARWGRKTPVLKVPLQILGWVMAVIVAFFCCFLGFLGFIIGGLILFGMGAGLYGLVGKLKRSKETEKALSLAAVEDPNWSEDRIKEKVTESFMRYQMDWSNRDASRVTEYMTQEYANHATLMMAALRWARRVNIMQQPTILEVVVVDMVNPPGEANDEVTVGIKARATDQLIDERTNRLLHTQKDEFTEFWKFKRYGSNEWRLDGIQQATAAHWVHHSTFEDFATSQGFYYSLDWGSLLIPTKGQIFKKADFAKSDINNHVIGLRNEKYLMQLYTYSALPRADGGKYYIVAQTNVPREYGEIFVRRRRALFNPPVSGLRKISTEWGRFNKKYDVFASSAEGATSFELLHPLFMEQLERVSFEVNIEVVDNIVYLYSSGLSAVTTEDYRTMMALLDEAYKQMKL